MPIDARSEMPGLSTRAAEHADQTLRLFNHFEGTSEATSGGSLKPRGAAGGRWRCSAGTMMRSMRSPSRTTRCGACTRPIRRRTSNRWPTG